MPDYILNIQKLYLDYKIPIAPSGHKHARRGWINIICPFHSGNPGYHLGYNLDNGYFFCWGCGWKPTEQVLSVLTNVDISNISQLISRYKGDLPLPNTLTRVSCPQELKLPKEFAKMGEKHRQYLANRNFNPDKLELEWGLLGSGHWGDYRGRIIAPITFRNQLVSFQGRDITDQQTAKYLPCKKEDEVLPHKQILYGFDKAVWKTCIVVEGVTGVWRLGAGSVGTFGAEYSRSQLLLLVQNFESVIIMYDPDEAGMISADKIATELISLNVKVEIWDLIDFDSGDMSDEMAEEIMKEIRK